MPYDALEALLDVLRNEHNLQIRYFDPQAAGIAPSIFIEPAALTGLRGGPLHAPDDIAEDITRKINKRDQQTKDNNRLGQ